MTDLQATTIDGVDVNILYDDTVMDNEDSVSISVLRVYY